MSEIFKNRYLIGIIIIGTLAVTFWVSHRVIWSNELRTLSFANRQQLEQFASHLDSQLSRYQFTPQLVAKNSLLVELLNDPKNDSLVEVVNLLLREINEITSASDTYLMDRTGLTLAASNWADENPFVGKNFSFRPYFSEAMEGKVGRYFALGTTSKKRGYYFSYPVTYNAEKIGVIVVKMDLSQIEKYWSERHSQFIVSDPDGIIFITTNLDWLYKSIVPLPPKALERIKASRRYEDSDIQALKLKNMATISDSSLIIQIDTGDTTDEYLSSFYDMQAAGWSVRILTPLEDLRQQSLINAFTILLIALSLLLISLLVWQWIRRHQVRERIHQEAHKQLEKKVSLRTTDLQNEIDEHKQTEKTLRETQGELIQTAKLAVLGQMSASISHELNNPLAAIRSYADNARKFLSINKHEKADDNLQRIAQLTDRMSRISSQLKFFSRKSSGQLESVNIAPIIQTAIEISRPQIKQLAISIDTENVDSSIIAHVDIIQLEQVLINLINNAIYAIGTHSPGTITITTEQDTGQIMIHVDDTGPGIDEQKLEMIFEPFYTTRESGLGLGLSISARIIDSMNGGLAVNNLKPSGARFTITLPDSDEGI
ncbi:sensor histidine kinase [Candidatus Thiodiazotropha sp. CDECU1]|uniref:sensor histidine kinase n=1 Tax=Candidatus Thiodiazotropha sp. CDECU1 TaxID=3065865 RepID=UPI00292F62CA|nr:ATP-binding protein [Candidatus Thiodiazotropha sp. CDECU1]